MRHREIRRAPLDASWTRRCVTTVFCVNAKGWAADRSSSWVPWSPIRALATSWRGGARAAGTRNGCAGCQGVTEPCRLARARGQGNDRPGLQLSREAMDMFVVVEPQGGRAAAAAATTTTAMMMTMGVAGSWTCRWTVVCYYCCLLWPASTSRWLIRRRALRQHREGQPLTGP